MNSILNLKIKIVSILQSHNKMEQTVNPKITILHLQIKMIINKFPNKTKAQTNQIKIPIKIFPILQRYHKITIQINQVAINQIIAAAETIKIIANVIFTN